jgi:hypothetical protein
MKAVKAILTVDHAALIAQVWDGLTEDGQEAVYRAVIEGLKELRPEEEGPRYQDVVRSSWALGFHYAMLMIEDGVLVKAGRIKVENN